MMKHHGGFSLLLMSYITKHWHSQLVQDFSLIFRIRLNYTYRYGPWPWKWWTSNWRTVVQFTNELAMRWVLDTEKSSQVFRAILCFQILLNSTTWIFSNDEPVGQQLRSRFSMRFNGEWTNYAVDWNGVRWLRELRISIIFSLNTFDISS